MKSVGKTNLNFQMFSKINMKLGIDRYQDEYRKETSNHLGITKIDSDFYVLNELIHTAIKTEVDFETIQEFKRNERSNNDRYRRWLRKNANTRRKG